MAFGDKATATYISFDHWEIVVAISSSDILRSNAGVSRKQMSDSLSSGDDTRIAENLCWEKYKSCLVPSTSSNPVASRRNLRDLND